MMEAMTFTPEQWARHERFVEMVRAAKQRKEAWVKKMQPPSTPATFQMTKVNKWQDEELENSDSDAAADDAHRVQ